MIKTEYRLANALKELMSQDKSLDDISVTLLTKKCKINRQTFYYHFHDIYDLLTLVFLNEEILHIKEAKDLNQLLEIIFSYYKENSRFLDGVIQSACKDLLSEFLFNNCYQTIFRIVNLYNDSKQITLSERKTIARLYAAGFSYTIAFYFQNSKRKTLEGLKNNFLLINDNSLQNSIKNIINARKNNGK